MTLSNARASLALAFLAAFLAVGVPYWLIPYGQVNLPSALLEPELLTVALGALILRACSISTFWKTVLTVGAAVPAAVLARVVWDGLADPTSHNLWPFEVLIAMLLGLPCALAGGAVGSAARKLASWT